MGMTIALALLLPGTIVAQDQGTTTDQASASEASTLLSPEALDALVGPIALYPDDLLAVLLPATTFPLQIVQASRLLEKRKTTPDLAPPKEWDTSVVALLNYPDVIEKLNDDLDWTQKLGDAVINQQSDVMDAVQQFRTTTFTAGNLQSNDQQVVTEDRDIIVIQSSSPDVIYVPNYDPATVVVYHHDPYYYPYYPPAPYYYNPAAAFWTGAAVGAAISYGFDWHHDDIDIDRGDININRGDVNIDNSININNEKNVTKQSVRNKANARFGDDSRAKNRETWRPSKTSKQRADKRSGAEAQHRHSEFGQRSHRDKSALKNRESMGEYGRGRDAERQSQRGQRSRDKSRATRKHKRQSSDSRSHQASGHSMGHYNSGHKAKRHSSRGTKSRGRHRKR